MTETTHPLNLADAERSKARVADIELGLADSTSIDWQYWRTKAEQRIVALEDDEAWFGLVPHEEEELAKLKTMLGAKADG